MTSVQQDIHSTDSESPVSSRRRFLARLQPLPWRFL